MRISRVKITNFANFSEFDVRTGESVVVVGENKVGKSNFVRALQLILDPGLSERDRQLGLEHFWDGLGENKIGETIEIAIELTDFTDDPRLMAHLNDCVVELRTAHGREAYVPLSTQGQSRTRSGELGRL